MRSCRTALSDARATLEATIASEAQYAARMTRNAWDAASSATSALAAGTRALFSEVTSSLSLLDVREANDVRDVRDEIGDCYARDLAGCKRKVETLLQADHHSGCKAVQGIRSQHLQGSTWPRLKERTALGGHVPVSGAVCSDASVNRQTVQAPALWHSVHYRWKVKIRI